MIFLLEMLNKINIENWNGRLWETRWINRHSWIGASKLKLENTFLNRIGNKYILTIYVT